MIWWCPNYGCVYMRTIGGVRRVDVIYHRIDDLFMDPEVFRSDSLARFDARLAQG